MKNRDWIPSLPCDVGGDNLQASCASAIVTASDILTTATSYPIMGYMNTAVGYYTNHQARLLGAEAAHKLNLTSDDNSCIAVTLCHPFGIGSAACSAFCLAPPSRYRRWVASRGVECHPSALLPLYPCWSLKGARFLFADTHTLKALPEASQRLWLRDGVIKIGSGATF